MASVPDSGSIVRVLDAAGRTVGVGVLLGPREILTCAHVVNAGLGRDHRAQDHPASEVTVAFAVGDGPPLRARVQRWLPPPRTGAVGDDIAGLVLTGTDLPAGSTPARLAANPPARGQAVDVFGYPGIPPRPHGAWVEATVRGLVGSGHLQLDSTTDTALRIQPGFSGAVCDNLLGQVIEWLGADGARFVMLLGDFGRGKTFLLRELVRTLPRQLPGLPPVLVELRSLEKAPSLDELLVQYLVRQDVVAFDVPKLRYMIRSGRLALLFDGFDELELRVGFDNAADYLNTLLRAVTDHAKVVLTSRTQHFRSTTQIRTALGEQVATLAASRVAVLEDFTDEQIVQFLTRHYGGRHDAARARFELLADVRDLLGLSRNPRMLSFIADLDEQRLRAVQAEHGQISAAELYRELVDFWLLGEAKRHRHPSGRQFLDEQERLAACTALALRLWATTALTIPMATLAAEVSGTLSRLAERGYTADQAAHTVGSGTLLVCTPEEEFAFVHQSVMEWLVARAAAEQLQQGAAVGALVTRKMSTLMLDFFCDLAGHEVARRWAVDVLADPAAPEVAKQNGLAITQRLGSEARQNLAGVDLRGQDLTNRDLRNANLHGADLRAMRLVGSNLAGADLRNANLTGVRMIQGDLAGAQISGSRWNRAALVDVSGLDDLTASPELAVAAIARWDRADAMIAPTGPVSGLAFSPDGALLAVARGHSVEVVDVTSGDVLRVLNGHTDSVQGVAFSPNGTLLATTSEDHIARLWDPVTGQHHRALGGHTDSVWEVAFSPDGTLLATTSEDHTARLWDPVTGQHHRTLHGHTGGVDGVAFSPDGTLLATASADATTRLWDLATGAWRATLLTLDEGGYAVLLPDGSYKLVGDPGRSLWWVIKLCRFAPGELDPYYPAIRQLPADAAIPR